MKNKILRILGVVVTLATLMSLFVSSTPVSADIHKWSTVSTPSPTGFVVSDWSGKGVRILDVGQLVYNSDKSVIYATAEIQDDDVDDGGFGPYVGPAIFKSTNSGRTWSRVSLKAYDGTISGEYVPAAQEVNWNYIYDLVTSPTNVNELYFTDGYEIYTSKDAGSTWTKISNLNNWAVMHAWTTVPMPATNQIVTLDLAQYGSTKLILAGTATFGGIDDDNGVFVCTESDFGMPWNDLGVSTQRLPAGWAACSVWDVKVDPTDFAVKQGVFAVVTDDAGNTWLSAKYMGNQWNQAALCKDAEIMQNNVTSIDAPYHAEIWLPSDFNSTLASGKFQAWVALATFSDQGDVYMWIGGAATTIDLNIAGADTTREIDDIDGSGPINGAKLIVSGFNLGASAPGEVPTIWYSADGYSFSTNTKRPTGDQNGWWHADTTVLALADYATSGKALSGTSGLGAAVSYTADFGKTWVQISLLATNVDHLVDIGGNFFLVTTSGTGVDSLWRQVTIGTDIRWERVNVEFFVGGFPTYTTLPNALSGNWDVEAAPDGTLFLADFGGPASIRVWRSTDNGQNWSLQFNDITTAGGTTITAWMPMGASSVVVGGVNKVYVTTTNGIIWFAYTCSVGTVTDFAVSGSTWLAVGVNGADVKAAKSTDSGVTWSTLKKPSSSSSTATLTLGGAETQAYIEAAADYATTGNVFVGAQDNGGVYRYPDVDNDGWVQVDGDTYDADGDVEEVAGMVSAPGGPGSAAEGAGMLYATDSDADDEGVSRIRGLSTEAEALNGPSTVTFYGLKVTQSGTDNVLWTMGDDNKIYTYTDTLNKAGSGVSLVSTQYFGSAIYGFDPGFATGAFAAVVKWNALPNASWYAVYLSTDVDDPGLYDLYEASPLFFDEVDTTTVTLTPLAPNTTYYVSVWATYALTGASEHLCSSFLFDKKPASFTTPPAVPNWTPNLSPMSGKENVQVGPTPFDWDDVIGATGYEFQIAEGNGIPSGTATVSLTQSAHTIANLKTSAFYTWRVRAMNGTVAGEWITSVFSTAAAPPPVVTVPAPTTFTTTSTTINIPTQTPAPVPTINLPQPTVIVNPAPITVTIPPGTTLPAPTLVLPEAETPVYIWIIVAVGALLTVAVIVLIIRTRRVV